MINFTTACLIRRSKLALVLMAGGFGLLVVFSNVTDYVSNYEYVGHVLSMDTTRPNEALRYRAITSPMLHHRILDNHHSGDNLHRLLFIGRLSALQKPQCTTQRIP